MTSERELVALLYRADWTRLSLSGTVRGTSTPVFSVLSSTRPGGPGWPSGWPSGWPGRPGSRGRPGWAGRPGRGEPVPPWPPFPPFGASSGAPPECTLLVAPGRRFREEAADGRYVQGCDGSRIWLWFADRPEDAEVRLVGGPRPSFPELLAPTWLLGGYQLAIEGETTACGRAGVRVLGTPRRPRGGRFPGGRFPGGRSPGERFPGGRFPGGARSGRLFSGGMPPMSLRWSPFGRYDHVSAVVDAELGILLRCERRSGDQPAQVTEFVSLTLDPDVDPALFTPPPGSVTSDEPDAERPGADWPFGWPRGGVGREAAKTVAGLAAGGLGAAIKYSPRARVDAFERATGEDDPEPEMPRDDPAPGAGPSGAAEADGVAGANRAAGVAEPVSDEVLQLLYRGGAAPDFTGTLHQWFDVAALFTAVPEAARKTGFGGVGLLVDALSDAVVEAGAGASHIVHSVRIGDWDKYRIDYERGGDSGRKPERRRKRLTVACDGEQRWQVYEDEVVVGPAAPLPDEIADLVDGSWLLECEMSGGEEIEAGGRRAFRVTVAGRREPPLSWDVFAKLMFPAVAVLDAESGRLIRITAFKAGQPVARSEFRDVAPGAGGDFGFEVPAGLRVVSEPVDAGDSAESAESAESAQSAQSAGRAGSAGAGSAGPAGSAGSPGEGPRGWSAGPGHPGVNPVEVLAKAAADAVKQRVEEKVAAARGFFDSLRGTRPPDA